MVEWDDIDTWKVATQYVLLGCAIFAYLFFVALIAILAVPLYYLSNYINKEEV